MDHEKENNSRQEMGYHGSNMHGYSMHAKRGKLDQFAGNGTKQKAQKRQETKGTPK